MAKRFPHSATEHGFRHLAKSVGFSTDGLHERIATALGWTVDDVRSMSLQTLRDVVRPVSAKLAHEITNAIQSGSYVT